MERATGNPHPPREAEGASGEAFGAIQPTGESHPVREPESRPELDFGGVPAAGAPGTDAHDGFGGIWGPPRQPPLEPEAPRHKPWWRRAIGALVALGIVVLSYGSKLKGLLLLLPKLKFATTGLSMIVSIAAYALFFGLPFAVGFVLLLLVHELGHVWQLRREGIPASAPLFIPLLGAVVGMKQLPPDAAAEARVGLAGPVLGTLGVLVPVGIYLATGDPLFRALAYIGFFLNLINLIPVLPLDGGRALQALSPWVTFVGFLAFVALMFFYFSPIMLLVVLFGGMETWRRFRHRRSPEARRFQTVTPRARALVAATYIGLVVVTGIGTAVAFFPMELGAASA
jgi:Zn-dependent protease